MSKWIPKEKQQQGNISPQPQDEAPTEISLDGVDIQRGISLSGGSFSGYLEILAVFAKNGSVKTFELEKCAADGNISLYTTHIHAMKSASANIGANALSAEAKALEEAGINGNTGFIEQNNPAFIANLKTLLAGINEVISAHSAKPSSGDFDDVWLSEQLAKLKTALSSFDMGAIDEITGSLQPYTAHPVKGEILDDILQRAFVGQYKEAQARIDELL